MPRFTSWWTGGCSLWVSGLPTSCDRILEIEIFGGTAEIRGFENYVWLFLIVFPFAPISLEAQGFYNRPMLPSRRQTAWQLFWGSAWMTIGVILTTFLLREQPARSVIIFFGAISFVLVFGKEEVLRRWAQTKIGQAQLKRRLILVGTSEDTQQLRRELKRRSHDGIEVVANHDLSEGSVGQLVELLHEHSANGIVLSPRNTIFGEIEKTIQACELEGVEVWLLADFFRTQISKTSLDDFYGRPMLVFRTVPEALWPGVIKQGIDVLGAVLLLLLLALPMLLIALLIKLTSPVLSSSGSSGAV